MFIVDIIFTGLHVWYSYLSMAYLLGGGDVLFCDAGSLPIG